MAARGSLAQADSFEYDSDCAEVAGILGSASAPTANGVVGAGAKVRRAKTLAERRLLNYGDIAISSSGQDDFEIVAHDIPDPDRVLEIIRKNQSKRK